MSWAFKRITGGRSARGHYRCKNPVIRPKLAARRGESSKFERRVPMVLTPLVCCPSLVCSWSRTSCKAWLLDQYGRSLVRRLCWCALPKLPHKARDARGRPPEPGMAHVVERTLARHAARNGHEADLTVDANSNAGRRSSGGKPARRLQYPSFLPRRSGAGRRSAVRGEEQPGREH